MNYLHTFIAAGSKMIKKIPQFPDFRLGVGKAENLQSVPIKVAYTIANRTPTMREESELSYEQTAYNGVSDGVTDEMFAANYDVNSILAEIEAGRSI